MSMTRQVNFKVIMFAISIAMCIGLLFGCQKKGNEIKLGATFPLTGEVASYGQKAKRGIEMAVAEINAKDGLLGKKIVVDFQDDRNDKKEAVNIVTKFATVDRVPVTFGSAGSSATLAVAPIADQHKVVLISPISSSEKLSTEGGAFFFRTCPADDLQAKVLADWVASSGVKQVAIVYTNNSWGKPLADGFEKNFTAKGGKVLLNEGVAENSSDFRTVIAKIKKIQNVDAIISPTYPKEGGTFVRQLKEAGFKKPLFGGDNWSSPEFRSIAGTAAEGVYYTAPSESKSPAYATFAQNYKKKYGEEPDINAAYSYDAAYAIYRAIDAAKVLETEKIKEALLNVAFTGVSGEIAFLANGDLASQSISKNTILKGQVVPVK